MEPNAEVKGNNIKTCLVLQYKQRGPGVMVEIGGTTVIGPSFKRERV